MSLRSQTFSPILLYPPAQILYPFQEEAVNKMLHFLHSNETHSTYNACEQGLGKSIQTIVACNTAKFKKVLIICPAIMRLVWDREITAWSTLRGLTTYICEPKKPKTNLLSPDQKQPSYIICSYDLARTSKVCKVLSNFMYDAIVFDEAHYCKNTAAMRTKTAFGKLWHCARYHILLSGTPFTQSVVDGYSPFHKILPSAFPDFQSFVNRYAFSRITPYGTQYFGLNNQEELRGIIRKNFYLRYTKKEVLPELPDKIYQKIILPCRYAVVPETKNKAKEIEVDLELLRRSLDNNEYMPIPTTLAEHRRIQGEKKLPPIYEFLKSQADSNIPTVVFAHHREVIRQLKNLLSDYQPSVVTGGTPMSERQTAIDKFQSGENNLFIGQFIAAGTGITLTRAQAVVLAELDWSPSVLTQAIDRVHRIGQKNSILVYYFTVEHSLDERIGNILMSKIKTFKSITEN